MEAGWALGIAIGSLAVAAISLGWNLVSWKREGPVVEVRAVCSGRGDEMKISGSIRNAGRLDAQIESARFGWYASLESSRVRLISPSGRTAPDSLTVELPQSRIEGVTFSMPLPAQRGGEFTVTDLGKIDIGLSMALHDRRAVWLTFQTASGQKSSGRVTYK